MALVAIAAIVPVRANPADLVCHASSEYDVQVDGVYQPNARVFMLETPGKFLIDIPSLANALLVDLPKKKAVAISRWNIKPGETSDVLRVAVPETSKTSSYDVVVEGPNLRLRSENSEVLVTKVGKRPPPGGAEAAYTPSAEARACLRWESLPAPVGTPGCAKFVYLRNSCDAPVVAQVSRTEHLTSGTLPQTFQVVVPAQSGQSIGCEWWSGAMAPSEQTLLGAGFLPGAGPHGHGRKDHTSGH
jgi:hypothetical protein